MDKNKLKQGLLDEDEHYFKNYSKKNIEIESNNSYKNNTNGNKNEKYETLRESICTSLVK
jgi:hypothetical protein